MNHQGQPIALVIAETLEQANHAATLVRVTYAPETATTDITRVEPVRPTQQKTDQGERRPPETRRGDPEGALAAAEVKVDQTYVIPRENHNPIEMHATIAAWDGDRLTLWDKTQWVNNISRRDRRRVRHPGGEHPRRLALRRRRLRLGAAHLAACDAGRARRPRGGPAGQGDAVAARDVLRRRLPPAHGPARRPRRIARRPSRSHCARRLPGDLHLRGVLRGAPQREPVPAFVPERLHAPPHRAHERAHADLHARAWRGERRVRARIRHGRARRGAEHRSRRAAPAQRAGAGRVQEAALLEPLDAGMLPGGRRALRLEPAQRPSRARCATGAG